ncbi:MAG: SpoIID/LytB domain-containing protein [Mycobacteriaceae bacterium]
MPNIRTDSLRHLARSAAVTLGAIVLGATALSRPPSPSSVGLVAMSAGDLVPFTGHGYGHGRGMGQFGALGYAQSGASHEQILAHYYGNTVLSQLGNPVVTVRLVGQDNKALDVFSDRGFFAGGMWIAPGDAAHITATPGGGAVVRASAGCDGGTYWMLNRDSARANPLVEGVNRDPAENIRMCGSGARYRGSLVGVNDAGALRTVSSLSMEDYLRGVVPRESPAAWADQGGAAALRAQAVAARSYSQSEYRYSYAKTCDTQSCQVYGGSSGEDRRSDAAIAATAGVVLTRGGAVARAEFSSSSGGYTAGGTFPAVVDDGDNVSPFHNWSANIPAGDIAAVFNVGALIAVQVTARNGLGADGGRVTSVTISGTQRTVAVTGDQMQAALGLRSNWFSAGFTVIGAIAVHYNELGGAAGFLGAATTNELGTPNGKARYNHFQGGSIYWSPTTGAREVHGSIRELWAALGWEAGFLALPTTDEYGTPNGKARYNHFESGSIYWSPATGAHEVHGAIRGTWAAYGWEAGLLGLPLTNEFGTPNGQGRYNHFQGGSVYWSPGSGSHEVHGSIRDSWAGQGWEAGSLGFPTSDEHDVPGGRASTFQGGTLTFSFASGLVTRS